MDGLMVEQQGWFIRVEAGDEVVKIWQWLPRSPPNSRVINSQDLQTAGQDCRFIAQNLDARLPHDGYNPVDVGKKLVVPGYRKNSQAGFQAGEGTRHLL